MSTDNLGDDLAELSHMLRVVADEKRLRILALLAHQELCVCDIMERLKMGQSLVSHHLGVLRQAGLVQDRRDAQWVYYSIDRCRMASLNARYLARFDVAAFKAEATDDTEPRKC